MTITAFNVVYYEESRPYEGPNTDYFNDDITWYIFVSST